MAWVLKGNCCGSKHSIWWFHKSRIYVSWSFSVKVACFRPFGAWSKALSWLCVHRQGTTALARMVRRTKREGGLVPPHLLAWKLVAQTSSLDFCLLLPEFQRLPLATNVSLVRSLTKFHDCVPFLAFFLFFVVSFPCCL